jgi:hypothetical protein
MPFIHSYWIIAVCFPMIIHSANGNVDHNNDIYFEVLEPCMTFHSYIFFSSNSIGICF